MKTIQQVLDNYKEYETVLDDRFGIRLVPFLTEEQLSIIGMKLKPECVGTWKPKKEWTRENILKQLKEDIEFGMEKANDERGLSSSLMFSVVLSWCKVLEEGLEDFDEENYAPYGKPLFKTVAEKYGWEVD